MFDHLTIKLAFAGIGHLLADYSIASLVAGALLVGSFFVDEVPLLGKVSADMRWAAVFIIGCLVWGAHIQHDDDLRWMAKQTVINGAVSHATTKPNVDPNKDKFDSPE
jgi:hypothetical protein